jgi:partner of Y14 and mago
MPPPAQNPSKSGIVTKSTGDRVIPGSVRADGSVRKEVKIRPGYIPPEDVEVYKNRTAEAFKNRGKTGVPGADPVGEKQAEGASAASNKNAKRREARKKAAAAKADAESKGGDDGIEGEESKILGGDAYNVKEIKTKNDSTPAPHGGANLEELKAKEAKKIAKKLRQAKELKEKEAKGDKLLPEQAAKVVKIDELIRELEQLGFNAEGEREKTDG